LDNDTEGVIDGVFVLEGETLGVLDLEGVNEGV
jgi:hypothetical protein